jgi:DMSO/TMAO reductase YedYZ heme-binding membrane subunit
MPFFAISAWNARLVPVFGFPLNALLFWLVWTKTPKEMRVHSRILLQTCIADLIFLSVALIASPVSENLQKLINELFD